MMRYTKRSVAGPLLAVVLAAAGCSSDEPPAMEAGVDPGRELMVIDPSVVNDPVRTTGMGAWTLGKLMQQMAPAGMDAADFTQKWLEIWLHSQVVNSFVVAERAAMGERAGGSTEGWTRREHASRVLPAFRRDCLSC